MHSEPALLESLMAHAMEHKTYGRSRWINPHPYKAVKQIIQRLEEDSGAVSDGVLGAVFTLAYHEV